MPAECRRAAILAGCLWWAVPVAAEEAPSVELLEFLGTFETAGGQWIDPTRLQAPVPAPMVEAPGGAEEKSDGKN